MRGTPFSDLFTQVVLPQGVLHPLPALPLWHTKEEGKKEIPKQETLKT